MGKVYNGASNYADRVAEDRPIVGGFAKEGVKVVGGAGQLAKGVFTGNTGAMKEGAKNLGSGLLSTFTGGAWSGLNKPPAKQYYGGSAENAAQIGARNARGVAAGGQILNQGLGVVGTAVDQAAANRQHAMNLSSDGLDAANVGMGGQTAALAAAQRAAQRDVGSIAAAQQAQANQQQNMAMQAQAAQARGGNQAAAMMGAQAQASANNLQNAQNLGMMRLAEAQQQRAGEVQARQFAAGQMGDRAQLGFSTALGGLGAANTSAGQLGNFGGVVGQLGSQTTGQFLDAEQAQFGKQLEVDTGHANAAKKAQGGALGVVGKVVGSVLGGFGG